MSKTTEEILDNNKLDIAIDFDGVIHSYTSGFHGFENILDPPVDGAIEKLRSYIENLKVAIFSTRASCPEGVNGIKLWLIANGLSEDEVNSLIITNSKVHANLYVDDRGWQFVGDNYPTIEYIKNFKPWNKMNKS